jgi:hypothetical protein
VKKGDRLPQPFQLKRWSAIVERKKKIIIITRGRSSNFHPTRRGFGFYCDTEELFCLRTGKEEEKERKRTFIIIKKKDPMIIDVDSNHVSSPFIFLYFSFHFALDIFTLLVT